MCSDLKTLIVHILIDRNDAIIEFTVNKNNAALSPLVITKIPIKIFVLAQALLIVVSTSIVTFITSLSMAAISTNGVVKGGK